MPRAQCLMMALRRYVMLTHIASMPRPACLANPNLSGFGFASLGFRASLGGLHGCVVVSVYACIASSQLAWLPTLYGAGASFEARNPTPALFQAAATRVRTPLGTTTGHHTIGLSASSLPEAPGHRAERSQAEEHNKLLGASLRFFLATRGEA